MGTHTSSLSRISQQEEWLLLCKTKNKKSFERQANHFTMNREGKGSLEFSLPSLLRGPAWCNGRVFVIIVYWMTGALTGVMDQNQRKMSDVSLSQSVLTLCPSCCWENNSPQLYPLPSTLRHGTHSHQYEQCLSRGRVTPFHFPG